MDDSITNGALKRLRKTPWRFQQTFRTPLKQLQPFVATIIGAIPSIQSATLTLHKMAFDPEHLIKLTKQNPLDAARDTEWSVTAENAEEAHLLLHAALTDWVDFAFVPSPKPFVIYADHDEYTTFFANTKSNLNRVVQALCSEGFDTVDYFRTF